MEYTFLINTKYCDWRNCEYHLQQYIVNEYEMLYQNVKSSFDNAGGSSFYMEREVKLPGRTFSYKMAQ